MQAARSGQPTGQLANVSAALILPAAAGTPPLPAGLAARGKLLERLFEDVVIVGGGMALESRGRGIERGSGPQSALSDLVRALEAAREERVLVLAADLPGVTADLLLGLTAWPEHACVAPRIAGRVEPLCALYSRAVALPAARRQLGSGSKSLAPLLDELDCGILEGRDLAALLPASAAPAQRGTPLS